jgi:hypothetical protein
MRGPDDQREIASEGNHIGVKAVLKRVLKLNCGEDVFEADDMMKWEGVERY